MSETLTHSVSQTVPALSQGLSMCVFQVLVPFGSGQLVLGSDPDLFPTRQVTRSCKPCPKTREFRERVLVQALPLIG